MTKYGKKQGGIILKKYNKIIGLLLAVAIMLPGMATKVSAAEMNVERLAGIGRVETSIAVSKEVYTKSDTVVLAGYAGEVDALTGTLLAGLKDAPLLLTRQASLETIVKDELVRLGAKNVYLLGGTSVISLEVENQLKALNYTVVRVAGDTREETAVKIAKEAKVATKHVFLAKGWDVLADALAVGPVSAMKKMPVLLTKTNSVPKVTLDAMKELGVTHVTLLGAGSAISNTIEAELKTLGYTVDRVGGDAREDTAAEIALKYFTSPKEAIIASGYVYADALVGGYLGAKKMAPILLTNVNSTKPATVNYLTANTDKAYVLGGTSAVSETAVKQVSDAINANEELVVESVSAINGLELQVTFSKPVDKDDVADNVSLSKGATRYVFTFGSISDDGKVVTLTANTAINVENETLTIDPVKSKDDDKVTSEKYVSLFTYKDTVAPSVVKNEGKDKSAVITFNEKIVAPVSAGTGLSVDGVNYTNFTVADKVLTINGLENGKTYKVEIVGAKDTAGNTANPINLTVAPVAPGAVVKQNVTISASGNKVTLNFVNPVSSNETVAFAPDATATANYSLDGDNTTEPAIQYSTDKKTVTIDAQLLEVMGTLNFQETKVTVDVDVVDVTAKDVEKTVTLTADKTAPKFVNSVAKNTTTGGKTLQLNFDSAVEVPISSLINLSITHVDGVRQATPIAANGLAVASAKDAAGKDIPTALVVTLDSNFDAEKSYTVKAVKDQIVDVYGNKVAEFTTTFTVPKAGTTVDPTAKITVVADSTTKHNEIKLTFGNGSASGLTNTSLSAANFTLGGKALPTGSVVEFLTDKNTILITLPASSIVTTGNYVLTLANIVDVDGNTLAAGENSKPVALKENVAPTVKSVTTPDSSIVVVTFSETVTGTNAGVTLKVNGTAVTAAGTVSGTTLTLTITDPTDVLELGDAVSVEFKTSDIIDLNGNKLADVTVNK